MLLQAAPPPDVSPWSLLQVIEDPFVEAAGRNVDSIAYEANALEAMRGRPGIVQLCGSCHGPADSIPQ